MPNFTKETFQRSWKNYSCCSHLSY